MRSEDLKLLKEALLQLRAEGPQRSTIGICGNLKYMLERTEYRGTSVFSWVSAKAYLWPELSVHPAEYPIGDLSTLSWSPNDEFGARRLRFLDYLIECVDLQGAKQ